jgi:hypothetical protein
MEITALSGSDFDGIQQPPQFYFVTLFFADNSLKLSDEKVQAVRSSARALGCWIH